MKRHLHAAVFLFGFFLFGCRAAPTPPPPEPVVLRFVSVNTSDAYLQSLVLVFNETYPHITVELVQANSPAAREADVFTVNTITMNELQILGRIMPLDPLLEPGGVVDLDDYYPGTVALFSNDGKLWAVPAGLDTLVMYYNQDLFDVYNVPYPEVGWTWDDFLAAGLALRDPNKGVFGYVSDGSVLEGATFVYQNGGQLFDDLENPTRVTFNDPANVRAMEQYAAYVHDYDFIPTQEQQRDEWRSTNIPAAIVSGKVGMWVQSFSAGGNIMDSVELPMRWSIAPLPRGQQAFTGATGVGYAIAAGTSHLEESWQWIAFLNEHPPERLIPARISIVESEAYARQVGNDIAAAVRASMAEVVVIDEQVFFGDIGNALGIFGRAFEQILNGTLPPQEALDMAQVEAEKLLP